jgi:hypothetical protein
MSPRIEVSVPRGRRSRPAIACTAGPVLGPEDRVVLEDIPMTCVARTIMDLASSFHEDRRRDRALRAAGIRTARVTWADLREPSRLADELRRIRAARLARSGAPRR